ncbi:MAG: response regulator transcription factor [Myxococcales bacterium]|nr:response regulator transcription factor [Myxococcales bacterium]
MAREVGPIWVAGFPPAEARRADDGALRPDGAAVVIRDLGAAVRVLDLFGEVLDGGARPPPEGIARLLVVEVLDRPDLLPRALNQLRKDPHFEGTSVLAVVGERSIARLDPAAGHDDFLVWPAPSAELYARIRQMEWRSSAYATDEVVKLGPLTIDVAARTVSIAGIGRDAGAIALTTREFSLLHALASRRGRVLSRETLLDVVWGEDYDGGQKTVDVHVRRLRAKLGEALPLETIRGAGYVLR